MTNKMLYLQQKKPPGFCSSSLDRLLTLVLLPFLQHMPFIIIINNNIVINSVDMFIVTVGDCAFKNTSEIWKEKKKLLCSTAGRL